MTDRLVVPMWVQSGMGKRLEFFFDSMQRDSFSPICNDSYIAICKDQETRGEKTKSTVYKDSNFRQYDKNK